MPLNIQLNQQSVKKLLLYSKPYNTLFTRAFASIPCESPFKGSLSLQVTFHPFNLVNSPAHGFLCSFWDCRHTNLQFCPHCGVPLGHGREREKILFWLITCHVTPEGRRWMISQPTGAQMNRNTRYQHSCCLLKGTMETALFPHGFRSTDEDMGFLFIILFQSI